VPGTAHKDERPGRLAAEDGRQIVAELQGAKATKESIAECCYHSMTAIA